SVLNAVFCLEERERSLRFSLASYDGLCLDPIALGDASSSRRCNSDVWVTPNSLCFPRVRVGPDVNDSLMFNKPDGSSNWVPILPIGFDNEVSLGHKVRKLRLESVGTCGLGRIQSLAPVFSQISSIFSSLNPSLTSSSLVFVRCSPCRTIRPSSTSPPVPSASFS